LVAVVTTIVGVGNSNGGSWGSFFSYSFYFFGRPLATKTLRASVRIRSGATGMASNTDTSSSKGREGRCNNGRCSDMSDMMSIGIRMVKAMSIRMVTVESVSMGFS
jgi:hypothetical protein